MKLKFFIYILLAVIVVLAYSSFFSFGGKKSTDLIGSNVPNQAQAFLLPISEPNYLPIRNYDIPDFLAEARAAGLYDVKSEKFLFSKNIDTELPIASVTKLMTATVVIENLDLDQAFIVPAEDINVDGVGADLYKDEQLKGYNLLRIMLIKSSNDAALVFASNARSQGVDLVQKMNDKAKLIGMAHTKFTDPAGLSDANSFSTVSDLVRLVRYVGNYQLIWDILKIQSMEVSSVDGTRVHRLVNTNKLLGQIPGIIGGKTGYTDGALDTMVLEVSINAEKDSLISVILGSRDRFGETKQLVNWGLSAYRWQ